MTVGQVIIIKSWLKAKFEDDPQVEPRNEDALRFDGLPSKKELSVYTIQSFIYFVKYIL